MHTSVATYKNKHSFIMWEIENIFRASTREKVWETKSCVATTSTNCDGEYYRAILSCSKTFTSTYFYNSMETSKYVFYYTHEIAY